MYFIVDALRTCCCQSFTIRSISRQFYCDFCSQALSASPSLLSPCAAEYIGTVQEPGPAAAPAHVPDPDALRHASGQRLRHQPRPHGDLRLQAQTALRAVHTKRGNTKEKKKHKTQQTPWTKNQSDAGAADWGWGLSVLSRRTTNTTARRGRVHCNRTDCTAGGRRQLVTVDISESS